MILSDQVPYLDRREAMVVLSAILVALLSTYLLFQDQWMIEYFAERNLKLEKVGVLRESQNDTRRRFGTSLTWLKIQNESLLFESDSLFTGPDSKIIFQIRDEAVVELSENSLLKIGKNQNEIVLDLRLGEMKMDLPAREVVQVRVASKSLKLKSKNPGSQVKLSQSENQKITIDSLAGEIEVQSSEENWDLKLKEKIEIENLAPLAIAEPPAEPVVVVPVQEVAAPSVQEMPAAQVPAVQPRPIDPPKRSPIAKTITVEEKAPIPELKMAPAPEVTPAEPAIVLTTPVLLSPLNQSHIVNLEVQDKASRATMFTWQSVDQADSYSIQFSRSPDFVGKSKEYKSVQASFVLKAALKGKIYWRVQAQNKNGISAWSETFSFEAVPAATDL